MPNVLYQPTHFFSPRTQLGFDPTYGYSLQQLLQIAPPQPPDDFAAFWQRRHERARAIDPRPTTETSPFSTREREVMKVFFESTDGRRIGGWLSLPRHHTVTMGLIVGHGYGGRNAPDEEELLAEAAILYFCARGFHLSRFPDIPETSTFHVIQGLRDRDHYVHAGCVEDLWCAANALEHLCAEVDRNIFYDGVSFGGGIGALALPWDDRIRGGHLGLPSFGHHPLRLTMPCTGSGEAVRKVHRHDPEAVEATLRYHDAASAALFTDKPVLVSAARWDPSVPPPGQFAIHNAWRGPKSLFVLNAGHWSYPGELDEQRRLRDAIRHFIRRHHQPPQDND
ncbi:MAG: cephalosporin-C deacetylase [Puniceicoccaceae bacterium 5H]|nr:MAG: cephalosporin-C deacetylase [Puniceicoccaceae bacterium 5H]